MRSALRAGCSALALAFALTGALSQASLAQVSVADAPPCEEVVDLAAHFGSGEDSGIGGTGRSGDDSGIGGTGIYGSITGFGSVCVNGLRVHHDAATQIQVNGRPVSDERLAVGQTVWIRAELRDGRLHAARVSAHSAAVGPLTAIDAAGRLLEIGRLTVSVPATAILVDEHGQALDDLDTLRVGDSLDVSGLRPPDGPLVATRIERVTGERARRYEAPPLAELLRRDADLLRFSVEGYVHSVSTTGLLVDGLEFNVPDLTPLRPGARVWLRGGVGVGGTLHAERLTVRPEPLTPPESRLTPPPTPVPAPPGRHKLESSDLPGLFEPGNTDPVRVKPGGTLDPRLPVEPPIVIPEPGPGKPGIREPVLEVPTPDTQPNAAQPDR